MARSKKFLIRLIIAVVLGGSAGTPFIVPHPAYARDPGPQRSRLRCTTRIHGPCEATFDGGKEAPKPARLYRDSDNR